MTYGLTDGHTRKMLYVPPLRVCGGEDKIIDCYFLHKHFEKTTLVFFNKL